MTTSPPAGPFVPAAPPGGAFRSDGHRSDGRWSRRLLLGAVVLALSGALGVLVGSSVQARSDLGRARASLQQARSDRDQATGRLSVARRELAVAVGEQKAAAATAASAAALLASVRASLAGAQASLYVGGIGVADLGTCLGGVQQALNQVALHDPNGALRSLDAVDASCTTVQAGTR